MTGVQTCALPILTTRRKIHMITENPFLFSGTVFDNIVSGLRFRRISPKKWQGLVDKALEVVGLENFNHRNIRKLSVGESQRVALARAIVLNPEILFLDEPFVNLDRQSICLIEEYIRTIQKSNQTTIIFTTHDFYQAWHLSNQVISLVNGRIVEAPLDNFFAGSPEEENGSCFVRISKNIRIAISQKIDNRCNICVHPEGIVISKQEFDSSARNSFKGVIKSIHAEDGIVRVTIRIDPSIELTTLITVRSYRALKLAIDSEVFAVFKATSVIIF